MRAKTYAQSGFGLLETITGLLVFMILAMVGTKAFKGVIANQKEANEVKALTDAVSVTAEKLSALSVAALTQPGSGYLEWSEPEEIGNGEYRFRYRTFPNPTIEGAKDTAVVGLEVETGVMGGGTFTPNRSFATLIAPHLLSKDGMGQVSTAVERAAEANFYASLRSKIQKVSEAGLDANQVRLNSFECYDKGQCCGFMEKYFKNPAINPDDGVQEKCMYRCALGGAVAVKEWNGACGTDFCALAPWKTQEQCCAAISAGACEPGSACAQVCIDCVGEDGTTCGPPICDGGQWNDFFDCEHGTYCDGTPLPTGTVDGWGNVKALCGRTTCAGVQAECDLRPITCCHDYWAVINRGDTPSDKAQICATISTNAECCNLPLEIKDWDPIECGTGGQVVQAHNKVDGKWYCGMTGEGWEDACSYTKGCPSTYVPPGGYGTNCIPWPNKWLSSPWVDSYPRPDPPTSPVVVAVPRPIPVAGDRPKTSIDYVAPPRIPSKRNGGIWGSSGGRE